MRAIGEKKILYGHVIFKNIASRLQNILHEKMQKFEERVLQYDSDQYNTYLLSY